MLDEMTGIPDLPAMELPLTDKAMTSFTLPSEYYTSPAVYEREKEAIFYRTWQYVAHRSAFAEPGDYVTIRICDQSVFVMMGGDGVLRAFYNVCRHRGHELLAEPHGNVSSAIVCPYHAWTFEREGGLRRARFSEDRPDFDKADFGLRPIRLELFCDCVFVNLDEGAESLARLAGDMEEDLRQRVPYLDHLTVRLAAAAGAWPRSADARVDTRDGGAACAAAHLPRRVAVVSAAFRARDGGELPVDRRRGMGEPRGGRDAPGPHHRALRHRGVRRLRPRSPDPVS